MKHLEYLSKNSTAYNSYFWWNEYYTLKTYDVLKEEMRCKFCELLNKENYESPNDYTNLESYWAKCSGVTRIFISLGLNILLPIIAGANFGFY